MIHYREAKGSPCLLMGIGGVVTTQWATQFSAKNLIRSLIDQGTLWKNFTEICCKTILFANFLLGNPADLIG